MRSKRIVLFTITVLLLGAMFAFSACSDASKSDTKKDVDFSKFETPNESGEADGFKNFETVGLDGKLYDQDLFKANKLTLVSIWGTYCPSCVESLPTLAELSENKADDGVGVMGILIDGQNGDFTLNEDSINEALYLLNEADANYTQLLLSPNLNTGILEGYPVTAVPTYFVVNSKGKIVGDAIVGAKDITYFEKLLDGLLKK